MINKYIFLQEYARSPDNVRERILASCYSSDFNSNELKAISTMCNMQHYLFNNIDYSFKTIKKFL